MLWSKKCYLLILVFHGWHYKKIICSSPMFCSLPASTSSPFRYHSLESPSQWHITYLYTWTCTIMPHAQCAMVLALNRAIQNMYKWLLEQPRHEICNKKRWIHHWSNVSKPQLWYAFPCACWSHSQNDSKLTESLIGYFEPTNTSLDQDNGS